MSDIGAKALALAGLLVALASLAHLACIALGARAYRFMGAGERMARAVEAGKIKPTLITLAIASVLLVWALYAFSGAGLAPRLPFTELALFLISAVFLARAIAFPVLRPKFPENSTTFWLVSSGICMAIGLLYAVGLGAVVTAVRPNPSLEPTRTGMALGPLPGLVHHPSSGPSATPALAPQLKR